MLQKAPDMYTLITIASKEARFAEKVEKDHFFLTKSSITLKQEYREAAVLLCREHTSPKDNDDAEAGGVQRERERPCVSCQFWNLL